MNTLRMAPARHRNPGPEKEALEILGSKGVEDVGPDMTGGDCTRETRRWLNARNRSLRTAPRFWRTAEQQPSYYKQVCSHWWC